MLIWHAPQILAVDLRKHVTCNLLEENTVTMRVCAGYKQVDGLVTFLLETYK